MTKSEHAYHTEKYVIEKIFMCFFDKHTMLRDVRRAHVESFISWQRTFTIAQYGNTRVKERISTGTINRNIATLSSFFTWAIVKEYYHGSNPCFKAKLRDNNFREVKLDKDQIAEMLRRAREIDEKLYSIVVICLWTVLRKGEIFSLKWSHVDFDHARIVLSKQNTKSKKPRVVPLTGFSKDFLLALKNNSDSSEFVFRGMTETIIRNRWRKLLRVISFSKLQDGTNLRIHDLRHVYAQNLLDEGVQLEDIQFLLGHESVRTTQNRYAMFARPDLHKKVEVLDNIIPLVRKSG